MLMTTQAGVWMDYRKAVAVILNNGHVDLNIIESETEAPSRSSGGHHQVSPYSHQDVVAEDHRKHRFEGELNKYFERITRRLKSSSELVLLGPGQAKKEFQNYLRGQHAAVKVRECKASQAMSNTELAQYVSKFYSQSHSQTS
jgi:stalled ribosome rescue protein Dom34